MNHRVKLDTQELYEVLEHLNTYLNSLIEQYDKYGKKVKEIEIDEMEAQLFVRAVDQVQVAMVHMLGVK